MVISIHVPAEYVARNSGSYRVHEIEIEITYLKLLRQDIAQTCRIGPLGDTRECISQAIQWLQLRRNSICRISFTAVLTPPPIHPEWLSFLETWVDDECLGGNSGFYIRMSLQLIVKMINTPRYLPQKSPLTFNSTFPSALNQHLYS